MEIIGKVETDKEGSETEFYIDSEGWNQMSEDEKNKAMIDAFWESGMVDVWYEEVQENED